LFLTKQANHVVNLETRIVFDANYQAAPLEAMFELSIVSVIARISAEMRTNKITFFIIIIVVSIIRGGTARFVYPGKRV
jgi:hypothetical protein